MATSTLHDGGTTSDSPQSSRHFQPFDVDSVISLRCAVVPLSLFSLQQAGVIFSLLLALLSFAGCTNDASDSQKSTSETTPLTTKENDQVSKSRPNPKLTLLEVEQLLQNSGRDFQELRLSDAEEKLLKVIDQTKERLADDPKARQLYLGATQGIVDIYNRQGRRWEVEPYLFTLLRSGRINIEQLLLLSSRMEILSDPNFTNTTLARHPNDPMPLLNVVRERTMLKEFDKALDYANQILDVYPDQPEALARKGLLLLELGDHDEFLKWSATLPDSGLAHPDAWIARGIFLRRINRRSEAERCFWEAAKLDPNSHIAHYQLGLLLQDDGRPKEAEAFLRRAELLNELQYVLHPVFQYGAQERYVRKAAALCLELGRFWEAWGWYSSMLSLNIAIAEASSKKQEIEAKLRQGSQDLVRSEYLVTKNLDLRKQSLPNWKELTDSKLAHRVDQGPLLHLSDIAPEVGLEFDYFSSPDPSTQGVRMFETTGGGVGVLDFDLDGWPDLHLTQGAQWPPAPGQRNHLDQLFQNHRGERFENVTELARLVESGFSQGITIGDFDNDGFSDIYVANTAKNSLFQNNGDGTFSEVDASRFGDKGLWTTSCMFVDLNGDGLLDLYNANYLGGDDIFDRVCGSAVKHSCAPNVFDGEEDQLFLNQGDGTWKDVSDAAGLQPLAGKGLGLIAARFGKQKHMSVFVANDAVANHFLVPKTNEQNELQIVDESFANGSAFDRDGRFQACMGVAFDDWDNDGRFDFYVTNYYNDSNTFYTERNGPLFDDATRLLGLRNPSIPLLGFGTQFVDIENDGRPDLVVTNGHVDDYSHDGEPFRMQPQIYRNQGDAFAEVKGNLSGAFFQGSYRGRGLATLDWNRDGKEDFAISHLDSPVALIENKTSEVGHYLALRFVSEHGSRDAFGTIVKVTTDSGKRIRQLAAGSGYQASNQQQLIFGLGEATKIESIEIDWPSGEKQTLDSLPLDSEWTIVEGQQPVPSVK